MPFQSGISGNPNGRPKGAKGRLPDKDSLCDLLDLITSDLTANYERLTISQKIRIVTSFSALYQDSTLNELREALTNVTSGVIKFDFATDSDHEQN